MGNSISGYKWSGGETVTPDKLNSMVLEASEADQGVAKIATQSEVNSALDDSKIVTPLKAGVAYLSKTGGTMTGPIVLASDPQISTHASNKKYVDDKDTAARAYTDSTVASSVVPRASTTEISTASNIAKYISPDRLSSAFPVSFTLNGYQKFAGGLIVQWGSVLISVTSGTGGSATVTFPISFPTSNFTGYATNSQSSTISGGYIPYFSKSNTSQCVVILDDAATSPSGNIAVFWMAIGY